MRFSRFSEMIGYWAERTPNAPALKYEYEGAPRLLTFSGLQTLLRRTAEEYRAAGHRCMGFLTGADGAGDAVSILAAVMAGLQVVLLDDSLPADVLRGLIEHTDVDCLYGDADLVDELTPFLAASRVADGTGRLLFFTSGTTDRSKAVVLTEQSLCASAYNGGALLPLTPDDTLLCILPLNHVFGFVCGLLWGLSCGACVALGRGRVHLLDDFDHYRPTAVSGVPLLLGFLLKKQRFNPELKLVLIGAGDCPPQLIEAIRATGRRVSFGYGLTETSSGVALSLGDDPYAMTVCPDDTITLAEDGEILITAPTCMMQGYYRHPDATAAVLIGGVLHTGDLGRFDEAGLLHVTGRKKEMLVLPDGTKLFLPEAEAQLTALLGPGDFALALRDGHVVLAIHGDGRGDDALLAAIRPYQNVRARGQQVSAIIRTEDPLPRTATGKIKRWELQGRITQ